MWCSIGGAYWEVMRKYSYELLILMKTFWKHETKILLSVNESYCISHFLSNTITLNHWLNFHKILKETHRIQNSEHTRFIRCKVIFFCKILHNWAEYSKDLNLGKILPESWTTFSNNVMSVKSNHDIARTKLFFT